MLLSNKSPPLGLIVAEIDLPPSEYFKRYSPPGCFCAPPASTNRNKPHVPGNFSSFDDEPLVPDGGWLVVLTDEFEEFADGGGADDDDVVADVEAVVIRTPVSDEAPGNVPLIEPVPCESVFCPSIVISTSVSLPDLNWKSYSNFGVPLSSV